VSKKFSFDLPSQFSPSDFTLFGFEGITLPSTPELQLAKGFDFYTLTNLSFMDLGFNMKYRPNLYGIVKSSLREREDVIDFGGFKDLISSKSLYSLHKGPLKQLSIMIEYPPADAVIKVRHHLGSMEMAIEECRKRLRGDVKKGVFIEKEMFEGLLMKKLMRRELVLTLDIEGEQVTLVQG